ncbi:MAG TPA: pyridoxal-phosphate dependent enzyme, partial [Dehalococcoidia bacterium]
MSSDTKSAATRTAGIADSVLDLIGNTPLVRLTRVVPEGAAEVLGKLESLNPGGSVKDRIALA